MMNYRLRLIIFAGFLFVSLSAGCGENTVTFPTSAKLEESQSCIDCHSSKQSPVTAKYVTDEWKLSAHNTKNKAGCADCHEPAPSHPNNCNRCHGLLVATTPEYEIGVTRNPDKNGTCGKCHNRVAGFSTSLYDTVTKNPLVGHFNNITSKGYPASYVSSQNVNKCRNCHNPHDTTTQMQQFREWARSGKGDVYAKPWTFYDFKTYGTTTPGASPATSFGSDCVRCHTATGFVNFISSGFTTIAPWDTYGTVYPGVSPDKTKEPLGCRACHDDGAGNVYAYKARTVGQITTYYNYSVNSKVGATTNKIRDHISRTYPDVSTSNMCLACHVGREIGDNIRSAAPFLNFSSLAFASINSHYLGAGATIYKTSGFHFYTSSSKYANKVFYKHNQVGVSDTSGTGTDGPCVTCHIGQDGEYKRHTFLPVDRNGVLVAKACVKCHDPVLVPSSSVMNGTVIEEERTGFNASLAVLAKTLKDRGYPFKDSYPYFGTGGGEKNWRKFTGGYGSGTVLSAGNIQAGALTLGAAFNLNLLLHDYGAFAHNRFYTKRLIYDAIDWMQDGVMGNGIETGVTALTDDTSLFTLAKNGTVFKIETTPTNTRELAIKYLQGTRNNTNGVGGTRP